MRVKNDADGVPRLPVISCLNVLKNCQHRLAQHASVIFIATFSGNIPEKISSAAAEYSGNADKALASDHATTRKFGDTHPHDYIITNCLILVDSPWGAVELGVKRYAEVLKCILQVGGTLIDRRYPDFLRRNPERQEKSLCPCVRILKRGKV